MVGALGNDCSTWTLAPAMEHKSVSQCWFPGRPRRSKRRQRTRNLVTNEIFPCSLKENSGTVVRKKVLLEGWTRSTTFEAVHEESNVALPSKESEREIEKYKDAKSISPTPDIGQQGLATHTPRARSRETCLLNPGVGQERLANPNTEGGSREL